ncbi:MULTISPECIES: hypothetical protein [Bombella]|uniref:Uncharacterized protein n=1 Tax=Bombella pollinis TaxID=2967337 RepID=A0ABT3WJ43_9PROT|nr:MULTISPECIES: hypothetical protein [Bombella]MCT6855153.1 hypothetical protein [Bombella apis]MCX5619122.1 hypothetical protein [Bombella pollinis]MUG89355.1 hypothetical protein [Bombella sp. ESL0385]
MKATAGPVNLTRLGRFVRTVWPKGNNEVFVIDGKCLILFHVVIVMLLIVFHWKLMGLQDF